jgi:RNA polymerase sigma-70 factor (ECF subfamily)
VPSAAVPDITGLLLASGSSRPEAQDELLSAVYAELRKIAHARLRGEAPGARTLETTALVNEAYLRLVDGARVPWQNRTHFFAVCARLMRRILVDHARARLSSKRGGNARPITLVDRHGAIEATAVDLLALDEALYRLAKADQRMAEVVQLRYFGGLTVEETAHVLGTSRDSVIRDWKTARSWLGRELGGRSRSSR